METVLAYMKRQNRPYNAQMLFENLHGEVKKTAAGKVLSHLASTGELVEKTAGKQKIYWPRQDELAAADADGLRALSDDIAEMRETIREIKQQNDEAAARNSRLKAQPTNDEAESQIEELAAANAQMEERLARLRSGTKLVSKADKEKSQRDYNLMRKEWTSRKRKCMDIVSAVAEGAGKRNKELMEETGVETDEDAGVSASAETRTAKRLRGAI
eukprot:TRINITY_DN5734_c0_g1_i1.p1 TRINITY_DN5734_c0_g1~~TRINITY_DN5734_c0_g1_i1.p1  ORF type:complete len:236 (-),score=48.81 TRINITY_DN5734_c0_g1_i1:74-718(-)